MSHFVELDPATTERRPVTLWIVKNKPFTLLECAEAAAAVETMHTRQPVPIEKVVIPIELERKLILLPKPEELGIHRAKKPPRNLGVQRESSLKNVRL